MKLTADMFDFEKYEYMTAMAVTEPQWSFVTCNHDGDTIWLPCSSHAPGYGLYRKELRPLRYILLNEGEKRQPGDQLLQRLLSAQYGPLWSAPLKPDDYGPVLAGEIWRRKVQE